MDARRKLILRRRAGPALLLVTGWLALGLFTQSAAAEPMCDVPDPPPICDGGPEPDPEPDPDPGTSPVLAVDLARQTTDRTGITVRGWTADGDAPQTPLTVRISVDGTLASTVAANASRADVAAAFPQFGAAHGYDVVVPASATAQHVCVTAVNVGSGADRQDCRQVDDIVEFDGNQINYDTANATIAATNLDQLDKVTNTNKTTVQQSTTISGQRALTDTQAWSSTFGLKVSVSGGVGIPLLTESKITVEGSVSFTSNGSSSTSRTFSWSQPVLVPAKSQVVATVAVTRSTLVVPYTMSGSYVYRSGARAPGSITGTYSGINSHDLEVTLTQYNLDGSPAARPVEQPESELSES
jgi:Clostridium epsilon toxin ETX/Bacillus mosquitocidal toxin MTX2